MAKKKTTKSKINKTPHDTTAIRGVLSLTSSLILLFSLSSFGQGQEAHHGLGLVGYTIGWIFHAFFGLGSYLLIPFLGWLGIRLLFHKPVNYLALKTLYFSVLVSSLCILLSLIEDQYPALSAVLGQTFYKSLWSKKLYFHLGGAPFYYLYHDLPFFNLFHLFNRTGVTIIFSSTLIISVFFLFKIHPRKILELFLALFFKIKTQAIESQEKEATSAPLIAEETKKEKSPEKSIASSPVSDFMRYVKLRTPESAPPETITSHSQEMLAIQPEVNLKVRPSLSRKEQAETDIPLPISPKPRPLKETLDKVIAPAPTSSKEIQDRPLSAAQKREAALTAQSIHNGDFTNYGIPSMNLLTNAKKMDQTSLKKDLKKQAEVLEETLLSFGIEAKVGQINCGPTITSFEVHPAIGVKVQKIKALEDDIALNMEAKSIRIIAPIPGKAAVGIEVPNPQPQEVGFKDMLTAYQQCGRKFHIPILLGKAVNGDYVMNDLAKMPHCIIAGATGSGKSVCINTIVMSILLNAKPDEIKLIMVDPKKVELTPYTNLPHMLAPVITEPQGACAALNWLVKEMERRYEMLKRTGLRNIDSFNTRTINKEHEATLGIEIPEKLPYIVGIIDELADLMMASNCDIETPIARIAQMARAVGIHLILATQRPSREVITGLIKANFPTRISFKVASRINSQIVLDETGAESLLGNGDMLFLPPGTSHLTRAQGAFIRDEDINGVIKHICDQAPTNYVIKSFDTYGRNEDHLGDDGEEEPTDALYNDAKDIILSTGNASTTFLQRKLKIGYARAASLMDQLELNGIVGPAEGSKPRKIFAPKSPVNSDTPEIVEDIEEELFE